jgi:hypothetical protein
LPKNKIPQILFNIQGNAIKIAKLKINEQIHKKNRSNPTMNILFALLLKLLKQLITKNTIKRIESIIKSVLFITDISDFPIKVATKMLANGVNIPSTPKMSVNIVLRKGFI